MAFMSQFVRISNFPRISKSPGILGGQQKYFLHRSSLLNTIEDEFNSAKSKLDKLKKDPGNDTKLQMYALFKQHTVGKCNVTKPGMFSGDMVGRVKWDAWNGLGDMSKEEAAKRYIEIVEQLIVKEGEKNKQVAESGGYESAEGLEVDVNNKVLTIRLNRPAKYNAITWDMYVCISNTLNKAAVDDSVKLVVFTGTGDYYCSGNDLGNFMVPMDKLVELAKDGGVVLRSFVDAFIDFPKPLVAVINGPAIGISVTILGHFDAVYASDNATFSTPFTKVGQAPEACSSVLFPRILGPATSGEVLLFNRTLTAEDAFRSGLVSRLFPADSLRKETDALIAGYAELPPESLAAAKEVSKRWEKEFLRKVNEEECRVLVERWTSEECKNIIISFMTKKTKK